MPCYHLELLSRQQFILNGHPVLWLQGNLSTWVPAQKSMTVAHKAAKFTLADNYKIKTGISSVSKLRHLWILWAFYASAAITPFFLKNKNLYKVGYRSLISVGCLSMQIQNESFSTLFLETSARRPKVNRKSHWTRVCYVTNAKRMFVWSK